MPFFTKKRIYKKIISLGLCAVLIYNTVIPAFAQEFNFNGDFPIREIITDNDAFRTEIGKQLYLESEAYTYNHQIKNVKERKLAEANPTYARALAIKYAILGDADEIMDKNAKSFFFDKEMAAKYPRYQELNDSQKLYVYSLYKEAEEAKKQIQAQYEESLGLIAQNVQEAKDENILSAEQIKAWEIENLAQLNKAHNEVLQQLDTYLEQEIVNANNLENEFQQDMKEDPDSFFNYIKPLISELLELYKQEPLQVRGHILEMTSLIVSLVNEKGEHLYNDEQADLLIGLYRTVIEEEKAKAEEKVPGIVNFLNENVLEFDIEDKTKTHPYRCKNNGACNDLTSAFLGLSVLDSIKRDNNKKGTNTYDVPNDVLIYDTMNTYHDTAGNIPVVSSGFSALLLMKSYKLAEDFLKYRNDIEGDIHWGDYFINFQNIATDIAKTNGEYFGNASQYGQYEDEEGHLQNVYFDLAQMLAEDGSKDALNILRRQGVERCIVRESAFIQKDTLSRHSIDCIGVLPFLVGSLVSGKSGAKDYAIPEPIIEDASSGNSQKVSDIRTLNSNFRYLAETKFNDDPEAMLALHVMSQAMGDLNANQEYQLDSLLDKVFGERIPKAFLSAKRIIIDAERKDKKYNRTFVKGAFISIGMVGDIIFTIYCLADLPAFGGKILSFGKNMIKAFNIARAGVQIKNLASLGQFIKVFNQNFFVKRSVTKRAIRLRRYAQAFREEIFSQGSKYTPLVDNHASIVTGFARRNRRFTMHLRDMLKAVVYDTEKDVFKFDHMGKFFKPAATKEIQSIFDITLMETKKQFRLSKFLRREADFGKLFLQEVKKTVASSHFNLTDKQTILAFFRSSEFKPVLEVATKNANLIRKSTLRNFIENPLILKSFVGAENLTRPSETEFVIADNMPAFEGKVPEFTSIIKHGEDYVLKFIGGAGETIDFSAFKLGFADTESFVKFVRQAIAKGEEAKIELKFLPKEGNTFWFRNVRSAFITKKEKLLSGRGTVSLISDGKLYPTGIVLRTYKKYDGVQLIVHDDLGLGNVVTALKNNKQLPVSLDGSLFLPKYQLKSYLKMTKGAQLENPIKISLLNGKNKIAALNLTQALSFSAASTGLGGYLALIYPELSVGEISLISVVIPYCLSAFTPFVSPIVKRFGASKVLKTSMALSAASLILPMYKGFTGINGIQEDNPFEKPSPYWLYPSAGMIALAAILTRGSFSPLIQSIGGGSGTLKAVAFKSVSGFLFVIPPMVGAALDYLSPQYFKNSDGSYYLNEKEEKVMKHWLDFSFSYPVMFLMAGGAFYKLQKSQFNIRIGREIGYKVGGIKGFAREIGSSYKVLFSKEVRNLTLASTLLAGMEGSLLYNYSISRSNEYFTQHFNTEAVIAFLAILGVNVPAFFARFYSKPYLKFMGGDNLLGYRNMTTLSLGLAGTGAYLMMNKDDNLSFATGMILTSIGCSQITSSILRYGHVKLAKELKMPSHIVTSWDVSYPTTLFGMSIIPYAFGKMADASIKGVTTENKAQKRGLKNTAYKEVKYVPYASLLGGSLLAYKGMSITDKLGLFGGIKGILPPLGLIGEMHTHNSLIPTPTQIPVLKTPFNLDGARNLGQNNFRINQFKANLPTLEFNLTPMTQE